MIILLNINDVSHKITVILNLVVYNAIDKFFFLNVLMPMTPNCYDPKGNPFLKYKGIYVFSSIKTQLNCKKNVVVKKCKL